MAKRDYDTIPFFEPAYVAARFLYDSGTFMA
jgi:hypothetical protein